MVCNAYLTRISVTPDKHLKGTHTNIHYSACHGAGLSFDDGIPTLFTTDEQHPSSTTNMAAAAAAGGGGGGGSSEAAAAGSGAAAGGVTPPYDTYDVLATIGKGSFGTVSKVRRRADGRVLVWKELNYGCMRDKEKQLVVSEVCASDGSLRVALAFAASVATCNTKPPMTPNPTPPPNIVQVNILREMRHPFIVRYYDRIIDKASSRLFIVMEFCEGGDLGGLIKKCRTDK